MAFNFNWSPLTADAGFYTRAQELLTTALNKSPKPPIIVDDILVNELNLGHVPPELEILEIGDLAEDRFRGIFKMSYNGDAFLTLKTRVQANPLNTHLLTRPAFASPQPLAAATGLTIPLQITLSDIKLSAFIILVFSRQKGLTLVFRNDPLESLKVSSTFDSIPFVANYLQKEIEGQLRILLMDELPAIIHRLSLRLWVPEHQAREEYEARALNNARDETVVDPLASPPQDPVDSTGQVLNPSQIASLSLDSGVETQSLFSQKNLIRLATLSDSHRTLSLFTPNIRDAVFRAWAGPLERGELTGFHTKNATPALSRTQSFTGSMSSTYTFDQVPQRPSLHRFASGTSLGMGSGHHAKGHTTRKRKKRVVNLRKAPDTGQPETLIEDGSTITDSASVTDSTSSAPSVFSVPPATPSTAALLAADPMTPVLSPESSRRGKAADRRHPHHTAFEAEQYEPESTSLGSAVAGRYWMQEQKDLTGTPVQEDARRMRQQRSVPISADIDATPRASMYLPKRPAITEKNRNVREPDFARVGVPLSSEKTIRASEQPPRGAMPNFLQLIADSANGGSIAERALMMKIAGEVSRRYEDERQKGKDGPSQRDEEEIPPPAYAR